MVAGGGELLIWIECLGFFVEGEDLAFDIFGYDLDFIGDLFFDLVPDKFDIECFVVVEEL